MNEDHDDAGSRCRTADIDPDSTLRDGWISPLRAVVMAGLVPTALLAACVAVPQIDSGQIARGEAAVVEWCAMCHAVSGVETDPTRAPTFEEIAARPGRDAPYLRSFLDDDHFPMTTHRLFASEKDDVAAFIASLRAE